MEDKEFKVTFESKDKHSFEFSTNAKNKEEAIKKGFKKIEELQYNDFNYILKNVIESYNQKQINK